MKFLRNTVVVVLLLGVNAAHAESPPNVVGTWKPTGETAAARVGEAVSGWPESPKPEFNHQPRPYIVIEVQNGRKIAGYEVLANGSKDPLVGVFSRSGNLIVSTMKGIANAEFTNTDVEWCWRDNLEKAAIVSCDVMTKQPSN